MADNEAAKPNPRLRPFEVLVGAWTTVGTRPLVPGKTFHGRTSFGWIEGGAFLSMHSQMLTSRSRTAARPSVSAYPRSENS